MIFWEVAKSVTIHRDELYLE